MAIRPAPAWETILKRNSIERLKHELFPTELAGQWERVASTSYEKLPEEDIVRLQWFGLYHDKPKVGSFMMRIKIPSGILAPRACARSARFRKLRARPGRTDHPPEYPASLHHARPLPGNTRPAEGAGLTTMGGCGDVVRNITGCPVAGIDREELFDVTGADRGGGGVLLWQPRILGLAAQAQNYDRGLPLPVQCARDQLCRAGRDAQGRPRRFCGPRRRRSVLDPAPVARPRRLHHARAGAPDDAGDSRCLASTTEYRISRVKARFKFMVDDYGPEGFRKLVEARLGYALEDLPELPLPDARKRAHGRP